MYEAGFRPFDRFQKFGIEMKKIMEPNEMVVTVCILWGLFGGVNCINCVKNFIVICIGPEMAVKPGFTK